MASAWALRDALEPRATVTLLKLMEDHRDELVVIAAPLVETAPPVPLGFRNPIALRVGLLAAALVCFTMMIPVVQYMSILWWLGAGYLSVWIYKRRTGQRLNVLGGARMGWITGIFCFVIATLFFTISVLSISSKGGLVAFYREQFSTRATDRRASSTASRARCPSPYSPPGLPNSSEK